MAKSAKSVEFEISARDAAAFVSDILAHFEAIESARGTYMQAARSERESMSAIYEGMAAKGVPQRVAKLEIQIVRTIEKLRGLYADLEAEDKEVLDKLARAQNDKEQLTLFGILPKAPKQPRAKRKAALVNGDALAATGSA